MLYRSEGVEISTLTFELAVDANKQISGLEYCRFVACGNKVIISEKTEASVEGHKDAKFCPFNIFQHLMISPHLMGLAIKTYLSTFGIKN